MIAITESTLQTPEWIREVVSFVAYKDEDGMKTVGTVFHLSTALPGVDYTDKTLGFDPWAIYGVTARHVVEKARAKSIDGKLYFRLNHVEDGAKYFDTELKNWLTHPSRNIDAAIHLINLNYNVVKHRSISLPNTMLTAESIKEHEVGVGDDLFFPGLFIHHKGETQNIPIVRTGTIAAMPGEPIHTDTQGAMNAYLIEARSLGGLSGSPVFLHLSGPRGLRASQSLGGGAWNHVFLLGMVQGHYGVRDVLDATDEDFIDARSRSINMGIAIVVPIEDIVQILEVPEVVARRVKIAETRRADAAAKSNAD